MFDSNQMVEIEWNPNNRKYLEDLGYKYEWRKKIKISAYQLWDNSTAEIKLTCDYCGEIIYRKYKDQVRIQNKNPEINKDACKNCIAEKIKDVRSYKLNNSLLNKNNKGYWKSKDNRLKELKLYIEKYKTLKNLYSNNQEGKQIWLAFRRYNHSIIDAINELGLDQDTLEFKEKPVFTYNYYPKNYFKDINNLFNEIQKYINLYGKFPTREELVQECHIGQKIIQTYGGINKIRKLMNYNNPYELMDDNQYKNRSSYEYITAQFLIHNNTYYLRDQHPFPKDEKPYQSDFMFIVDNKIYHCEIWGYANDTFRDYTENKKEKIRLYNKYNINLIPIDNNIFRDSYDNIQIKLKEIFEPVLGKTMKVIPQKHLVTVELTNNELFNKIMEFSNNKNVLPSIMFLRENNVGSLHIEAIKRFGSYSNFAEKYGVKTIQNKRGYWTRENLIKECLNILSNNMPLDFDVLRKNGYNSIVYNIQQTKEKTISFRLYILSLFNGILPDKEIKFLNNIINNRGTTIMNKVTSEQQKQAQYILTEYSKKLLQQQSA